MKQLNCLRMYVKQKTDIQYAKMSLKKKNNEKEMIIMIFLLAYNKNIIFII